MIAYKQWQNDRLLVWTSSTCIQKSVSLEKSQIDVTVVCAPFSLVCVCVCVCECLGEC